MSSSVYLVYYQHPELQSESVITVDASSPNIAEEKIKNDYSDEEGVRIHINRVKRIPQEVLNDPMAVVQSMNRHTYETFTPGEKVIWSSLDKGHLGEPYTVAAVRGETVHIERPSLNGKETQIAHFQDLFLAPN